MSKLWGKCAVLVTAVQYEPVLESVVALVLAGHLCFLPKAISDGHQPPGLVRTCYQGDILC